MSRHLDHAPAGEHAAHHAAPHAQHGGDEVRQLVRGCGRNPGRLRQLLHRVKGQVRAAAIREAQRLYGIAFVRELLAARPRATEHAAPGGHHDHAHDGHHDHAHDGHHDAPAHSDAASPHAAGPDHGGGPSAHPASAPAPAPAALGVDGGGGVKAGDHGPEVAELQRLLQAAGYYHGAIGGNFGPQTEAALRKFQREHGLAEDGRGTPATLDALRTAAPAVVTGEPGAPAADGAPAPASTGAAAAVSYGVSVLGAPYAAINPYRFGEVLWPGGSKVDIHGKERGPFAAGTQVFDCSGFVTACWKRAGVDLLGRGLATSAAVVGSRGWLIPVSPDQLQPGDLIAYPGHIVMYFGNGQVIQSTPNGGVKISAAGKYLSESGVVCRRVPA